MITDITEPLSKARERSTSWTVASSKHIIQLIMETLPQTVVKWDAGAGEGWATILDQSSDYQTDEVVAFVRIDAPLVIVKDNFANQIEAKLSSENVVIIKVPDMNQTCYSLDSSKIAEIFPHDNWSSAVDPKCFSISDLWYITV